MNSFDLIILDADGTIAPHITVGLANKIFMNLFYETFFSKKFKTDHILRTKESFLICLTSFFKNKLRFNGEHFFLLLHFIFYGMILYCIKYFYDVLYFFHLKRIDNTFLLRIFERAILKANHHFMDVVITKKELENSLYPGIKKLLSKLKGRKVIISQSFSPILDLYKQVLNVDSVYGNKFTKNAFELNVTGSDAKKKIGLSLVKNYKPKRLLLFLNDYHDLGLSELPNAVVVSRRPPRRLAKRSDFVVKDYIDLKL